MNSTLVHSYSELIDRIGGPHHNSCSYFYRGISSKYPCIPSMGYNNPTIGQELEQYEWFLLDRLRRLLDNKNPSLNLCTNNFIYWAIGRHTGLPSRLMDFTFKLNVAIQFGFEMCWGENIYLYVVRNDEQYYKLHEDLTETDLYSDGSFFVRPSGRIGTDYDTEFSRIVVQCSKLYYQPYRLINTSLEKSIVDGRLRVFEIPYSHKDTFYQEIADIDNEDITISVYDLHKHQTWRPYPELDKQVKKIIECANREFSVIFQ